MAKPPKIVIPGLNRGIGIRGGYIVGRLPTSRGPAQLLGQIAMRQAGYPTTAGVNQSVSSVVSTVNSEIASLSTAVSTAINSSVRTSLALGMDGEDGQDAFPIPGSPGQAGSTGATGPQGPIGIGLDGEDGADGIPIPGTPGAAGAPGAIGPQGPIGIGLDGEDGQDGMPIPGIPGAQGTAGSAGATGAVGPQGPIGWGIDGQDGDDGLTVPGTPGAPGAAGAAGAVGPQGPIGLGLDGSDGDDGMPVPGPQGLQGATGATGPQGPAGTGGGGSTVPGLDGQDGDDGYPIPSPNSANPILLALFTGNGSATSFDLSGIGATFRKLTIEIVNIRPVANTTDTLRIRLNGDTGTNYQQQRMGQANGANNVQLLAQTGWMIFINGNVAAAINSIEASLLNYAFTDQNKSGQISAVTGTSGSGGIDESVYGCVWLNTAAVTELTFALTSGAAFKTGGTIRVYGWPS